MTTAFDFFAILTSDIFGISDRILRWTQRMPLRLKHWKLSLLNCCWLNLSLVVFGFGSAPEVGTCVSAFVNDLRVLACDSKLSLHLAACINICPMWKLIVFYWISWRSNSCMWTETPDTSFLSILFTLCSLTTGYYTFGAHGARVFWFVKSMTWVQLYVPTP